jgi:TonB-linked SusC/RagA family outer membrane protein
VSNKNQPNTTKSMQKTLNRLRRIVRLMITITTYGFLMPSVTVGFAEASASAEHRQKTNQLGVQGVPISFSVQNAALTDVFAQIEKQAGVSFSYDAGILATTGKITLMVQKESLSETLRKLSQVTGLVFKQVNLMIGVSRKAPSQSVPQKTIQGKVTDGQTGESLPGVNIVLKGTSTGTISGTDGTYTLSLPSAGAVLIFSYVGYLAQEVTLTGQSRLDIKLAPDVQQLNAVVVTALGIKRNEAQLGYAVQKLDGESLTQARETNLGNALAGKIAGVSVVGNPSGIGGSARITIRGERSLNINKNQPLFVVDGVPIVNELVGSSGRANNEVDYGNSAGMINPDDIESMVVLKGPNAAALYGSRGQNGVIIIKTKSGRGTKGIGVSVNSTVSFERPLKLPTFQNTYGQGVGGVFAGFTENASSVNWGPRTEGQLISQYDSPTGNGFRGGDVGNLNPLIGPVNQAGQLAARGNITPTPFLAYPDNMKDFFETGVTYTQNVAVTSGSDKGSVRGSYTYLNQKGMIPNTDLKRHTFALSTDVNVTDKLQFAATANYVKGLSANRPNLSYGQENLMYFFVWSPRSLNTQPLRNYWQPGRVGLNQFNFNYNFHDNPYLNVYENTNGQEMDRLYGNVSATYTFTNWLSLMGRVGTDYINEFRDRRRVYSLQRFPLGAYREEKVLLQETNADFLLTLNKPVGPAVKATVNVGGNLMFRKQNQSDISAPQLLVPGVYTLGNSRLPLEYSTFRSTKQVNSLYASSRFSYKELIFLDISGRNDWSSTLPADNRSYFYPAASTSIILSDLLRLGSHLPLSFAKVRVGYAEVGNDTDPYQLTQVYTPQAPVQGQSIYGEPSTIPNLDLKPERSRSLEAGLDLRFFKGRLGLDVAVYRTRTENQILSIRMSNTTGYSRKTINAGLVENKGYEVILNGVPVRANGFTWSVDVNFSQNRGRVLELYVDPISGQRVESHILTGRYLNVEARVGERMGDMYGRGYARVSSDPKDPYYDQSGTHVGRIVYTNNGTPLTNGPVKKLGNYNPDWLAGITNSFSFKGLSLGFLVDIRSGGEIYSHTNTIGREAGSLIETLEGRANGYDLAQEGNGVVGDGVVPIRNADGAITGFTPNAVKLDAQAWHIAITGNRNISEGMIFDASFVKLREVKLGYRLPGNVIKKLPFSEAAISIVGRNLALWSNVPHIDPETSSTAGGTIVPGVDSMSLPSARSFGINVGLKF